QNGDDEPWAESRRCGPPRSWAATGHETVGDCRTMPDAPDAAPRGEAAYWDSIADEWRKRVQRSDALIADFVDHLGCPPGSLILDAGCGTGTMSVPLALRGYRLRGIDLAPQMIANASDLAREQGLTGDAVQFQVGDVERLPFEDATFDAMLCVNVLDF